MLTKFQEDQRPLVMLVIKCLNFKLLLYKIMHKKINLLME